MHFIGQYTFGTHNGRYMVGKKSLRAFYTI